MCGGNGIVDEVEQFATGLHAAESFLNDTAQRPETSLTTELRLRHLDGSWREFEVIANNLIQ